MQDTYGRQIDYMRISITDRCNLRCRYCMPDGIQCVPMKELLTYEEIEAVCCEAASLGIRKFKITGGEPLVRKDCGELIRMIKRTPGVEQVTLTTNGVLLGEYLDELIDAGLDAVNISLDTLDAKRYREITGFDELDRVLKSMEAVEKRGLRMKINTVLQNGINSNEWTDIVELARDHRLDVRFIEMMPIGSGKKSQMISNDSLIAGLKERYGGVEKDTAVHGNGPAVYYKIPGFKGSVGFISAIHGKFCDSCNRIRMTSTGKVKPCLCFEDSLSIREAAQSGNGEEIRNILREAISRKPQMHCFEEECSVTEKRKMAQIGG